MASMTDPARELGEIAKRLTKSANSKGAQFLADSFGVPAWSTEFYKIIACILDRADLVATVVQGSSMDEDHKQDAVAHLDGFKSAFAAGALVNSWNTSGHGLTLMKSHGDPIQFMAATVRPVVQYPRLSDDEIAELLTLIDRYRVEVATASDAPPFVRQAILDGLNHFRFQLEHIGWLGAGYALSAFREVLRVYESLQREEMPDAFDPQALLSGLTSIIKKFNDGVQSAKGWADTAETVWKVYRIGSAVATPLLLTSRVVGS